jgi:hypothetical protein
MSQPFGLRLVAGTPNAALQRPIRSTEGRLFAWLHIPRMGGDHLSTGLDDDDDDDSGRRGARSFGSR